ncbi:MAG: hypothetical protein AAFO57_07075 [Pseudomonadota bacterium]
MHRLGFWRLALGLLASGCGAEDIGSNDQALPAPATLGLTARTVAEAPAATYTNANWYAVAEGEITFTPGERHVDQGVFVAAPPKGAVTIDLEGAFVVPPFGEAHNHSIDGPWTMNRAEAYLTEGVFYFKNPNDVGPTTRQFRSIWAAPDTLDAVFAHGGLSIDEGHPEVLYRELAANYQIDPEDLDGKAFFNVETPELLEEKWSTIVDGAPDFLKVYLLDHDEAFGESDGLSEDMFRRVIDKANSAGFRTTVHVETVADFALAIDAGASEVAHLPGYNPRYGMDPDIALMSDDVVAAAAENGFITVTTAHVSDWRNEDAPETKAAIQANQAENLRRLHDAGAPIAIGTDTFWKTATAEIDTLRDIGAFSDADLLRLWIETPRLSIFPERAIGELHPGFEASFLALACNPADEFDCTGQINRRIKQGLDLDARTGVAD